MGSVNKDRIESVRVYLNGHRATTLREVCEATGLSQRTVQNIIKGFDGVELWKRKSYPIRVWNEIPRS